MVFESLMPFALLPLRVMLGVVFLVHGYPKLLTKEGFQKHVQVTQSIGFPLPSVFALVSGFAEFVGGLAILFGIFTSIAALLIIFNMLVATYAKKVVWKLPFDITAGGYEYDLVLVAAALTLLILGAGFYSIDMMLGLPLA